MKALKAKHVKALLNSISEYQLNLHTITLTTVKNTKVNGRFNKKNAIETTETITTYQYLSILESIPWFLNAGGSERLLKSYTSAGFIPTELESMSPDREQKTIRKFTFKHK